jgi:hypothetical protein
MQPCQFHTKNHEEYPMVFVQKTSQEINRGKPGHHVPMEIGTTLSPGQLPGSLSQLLPVIDDSGLGES